ncbi:MAG: AAA family ATPase [Gemmataceae bacterium]|nr:AAA family ATPase [Gemmataceae bacterium]
MYEAFYGLKDRPFNLTPDPRYLYLSQKHKEAFAHLLYGIKNRSGFVMVSGEIGTGKTTICRTLVGRLDDNTEVAFIFNPCLSAVDLLRKINEEFGISTQADSVKGLIDELNSHLLDRFAEGKNCVLIIDEAQDLDPAVLEQIRLLSNLETEREKLLQIILIGQPELVTMLSLPELRQLNQRVTARYHLRELDRQETGQYIAYRLRVAGARKRLQFTPTAIREVYRASAGTPRVINAVCDRALLVGYTQESREITSAMVRRAAREVRGERIRPRKPANLRRLLPRPAVAAATLVVLVAVAFLAEPMATRMRAWLAVWTTPVATTEGPGGVDGALHLTADASTNSDEPPTVGERLPEPPTIAALLDGLDARVARNAAAMTLLRAWNMALMDYPADGTPEALVKFAADNGMDAEVLSATADQLATINLPAFVKVTGNEQIVWTGLVGLGADTAELALSHEETMSIPRAEFEKRYVRQAVILWRDAEPQARPLRSSARGDGVRALQTILSAYGRLDRVTGVYDAETVAAVRALQDDAGLDTDGVAGRQVRMVLAAWAPTVPTPSLATRPVPETLVQESQQARVDTQASTAPRPEPAKPPSDSEARAVEPKPAAEAAEPAPAVEPEPAGPPPEATPEAVVESPTGLDEPAPTDTSEAPEEAAVPDTPAPTDAAGSGPSTDETGDAHAAPLGQQGASAPPAEVGQAAPASPPGGPLDAEAPIELAPIGAPPEDDGATPSVPAGDPAADSGEAPLAMEPDAADGGSGTSDSGVDARAGDGDGGEPAAEAVPEQPAAAPNSAEVSDADDVAGETSPDSTTAPAGLRELTDPSLAGMPLVPRSVD